MSTAPLALSFNISDVSHLSNRQLEGLEDGGDTQKGEGRQQAAHRIELCFSGQGWQQL